MKNFIILMFVFPLTIWGFEIIHRELGTTLVKNAKIEAIFYHSDAIKANSKLSSLNEKDMGFHKTMILHKRQTFRKKLLPVVTRPLLEISDDDVLGRYNRKINKCRLKLDILRINKFVNMVSSNGYFPGEKVILAYYTPQNDIVEAFPFIPHPIKSAQKHLSIEAELTFLDPPNTSYSLTIYGFEDNEEFAFFDGRASKTLHYHAPCVIPYTPEVVGKEGTSEVKITSKDGLVCSLNLPWGLALFNYLNKVYISDSNMP